MSFPPIVLDDYATIELVWSRRLSFARLGDGEYRLVTGKSTKTQRHHPILQGRLGQVLKRPDPAVLVGILDLYSGKAVGTAWPARRRTEALYGTRKWAEKRLGDNVYGCASVTRMCNWALGDRDAWRYHVRRLWLNRDVLLVTGSDKGMAAEQMLQADARTVTTMRLDANTDAWGRAPWLLEYCRGWAATTQGDPIVLLAMGATATILAHDLGALGIQSIDIGHLPQSFAGVSPKGLAEP